MPSPEKTPPFPPHIAALPASIPFLSPEAIEAERGRPFRARLGANELILGPAPSVIEAMADAAQEAFKYPDPNWSELRDLLAARHNVPLGALTVGEGIDGLLQLTTQLFVAPGDKVVTSRGAYPTFSYHVLAHGGELQTVPYRDDHEDHRALLQAACQTGAKLVYLANPDNPMGTALRAEDIDVLRRELPQGSLLVLDEAYAEFAPEWALPPITPLHANVIRFRTFSKAFGLAGQRIGYLIAPPQIARAYDKVRNHFGVNRVAQAAAVAALQDQAYFETVQQHVKEGRERLYRIAAKNDLKAVPSYTNFVAIDCGRDSTFATNVLAALIAQDIFIRMPGIAPLDRCIRASVTTDAEMDRFAACLPLALRQAGR